jgi:hypothetical protein
MAPPRCLLDEVHVDRGDAEVPHVVRLGPAVPERDATPLRRCRVISNVKALAGLPDESVIVAASV